MIQALLIFGAPVALTAIKIHSIIKSPSVNTKDLHKPL
jgi:hypothetical protein